MSKYPRPVDCPIPGGYGYSAPEGSGVNGVLVLGEALGATEAHVGTPFVKYADAGAVLERAFKRAGMSREQFRLWNIVGCFPGTQTVNARAVAKLYRRKYTGLVTTLRTTNGILTGTPNHPALTLRGWVPLGEIVEGDYLVGGEFCERMGSSYPDIDNPPTSFEELFSALSMFAISKRMIDRNVNFHGDGKDAEVEVIAVDRLLRDRIKSSGLKHLFKYVLEPAHDLPTPLQILGPRYSLRTFLPPVPLSALSRLVSRSDESLSLVCSESGPADALPVTSVAEMYADSDKAVFKTPLTDVEVYGYRFQGFPRFVEFAKVVDIKNSSWSGHVFNLETSSNQFTTNRYIVHNCQPPKNWLEGAPYEVAAIAHCRPALDAIIAEMRPRCILTLGNVPTKVLTGLTGEYMGISYLRGYVLPSTYGIPVVPSFHPSFLRRGAMELFSVLVNDIKKAVTVAQANPPIIPIDPLNPPIPPGYILNPTENDAHLFLRDVLAHPEKLVTYDIETPRSAVTSEEETDELGDKEILSVQFSLGKGSGIFIPWRETFVPIIRNILASPNQKAGHNTWRFDDPLLEAHGCPIAGTKHDTRWAWHHLQPELKGNLQFVASFYGWPFPWKHLHASNAPAYGIFDVDSLQWICGEL